MDICFIERKRGKVLLHDGRQYYKLRKYKNDTIIYNCSRLKKEKCCGSITIEGGGNIIKSKSHSCLANYRKNEIDLAVKEIREQAMRTDVPIPQLHKRLQKSLLDKGYDLLSDESLPSLISLKTAMYGSRKKTFFNSSQDVIVPEQHESFLLCDYSDESCRILVFCSEQGKELMTKTKEIFADGTFKSCPRPFDQIYTIHGDLSGDFSTTNVVPMIYAIMTNRKEETYKALFGMIKSQIPDWSPTKFHADFEISAINAIKAIFPEIVIKYCYYHYTKSHWRKAKELKLNSKRQRRIVGLCTALALLPNDKIYEGWEYIKSRSRSTQNISTYLNYVEKTWLKNEIFVSQWSVYGERHRTNNAVESWNSQLNKDIKKRQPCSILRFLNVLCERENNRSLLPNTRQKDKIDNDEEIMDCQLRLVHGEVSVGTFLEMLR